MFVQPRSPRPRHHQLDSRFITQRMTDSKCRVPLLPLAVGLTSLAALSYYALRVEPFRVELTHPKISLKRLPQNLDGMKILFLADMHIDEWTSREDRVLELSRSCPRPDLIVWGGDFLRSRRGIPHALELVKQVSDYFPDVPTFAILGNAEHKLMVGELKAFIAELECRGVSVLNNSSRLMNLRGETFNLIGVDDPYYGYADLKQALEHVALDRFTLLLAHSPQITTQAARAGVDLMISGHTHGGQVRLPFLGPLKTQNPLCHNLDMGLFDHARLTRTLGYDPGGDICVYITRGIGLANVPGIRWAAPRFLCPPEVSLLTLCREKYI